MRDPARDRAIIGAFLAASRAGDFDALMLLLDADVTLDADAAAVRRGASLQKRGSAQIADTFVGRPREAQVALVDGEIGLASTPDGKVGMVFRFDVVHDSIVRISLIADADRIDEFDIALLGTS